MIDNVIDRYLVLNCKALCDIGIFVIVEFIMDYDVARYMNYMFKLSFKHIH